MDLTEPDETQVIPAVNEAPAFEEFAFLPAGDLDLSAEPSWEDRYAQALSTAVMFTDTPDWHGDPSRVIAACRLAGEIREGLAAGLLPRVR